MLTPIELELRNTAGAYLIHLDSPLSPDHTAQHYIGYSRAVGRRLEHHRKGRGARFLQVANERGIDWQLARVWYTEERALERRLKNQKNAPRLCPLCSSLRT